MALFPFTAVRGERVKNPSALSLPNHRQPLSPLVLISPEPIDSIYPRSY
ncbi:MAG: hypothetical protein LBD67_06590 [Candidatus Accumulibacter sp.]|nr:hypothetical protein [Accumulibacter sp.]